MKKSFNANIKSAIETIVTITLATLAVACQPSPVNAATETFLDSITTKTESTSTGTLYTFSDGTGYYEEKSDATEDFSDGLKKPDTTAFAPTLRYSMDGKYYPLTGIITSIVPDADARENVITFECGNGNMFQFTDSTNADWDTYDLVSCVMDNNGTAIVYDDEVVTTMYAGYTGQFQEIEGRD
jgi:hypothetical protein|nr:MAG TPA: hypothetical protein [Caudoviricetes sp.]